MLPWVHWLPEMKGIDCFIPLFYSNIFKRLSETEIRIILGLNFFDTSYLKDISKSMNTLIKIDSNIEYASYAKSKRLKKSYYTSVNEDKTRWLYRGYS